MGVEPVGEQRFGHTQPVEHAADAVDAEAPEGAFAVLLRQLLESAHLVRASWMKLQFTAFPACPGVGRHLEELGCVGLCQVTQGLSRVDQVQILARQNS